MFNPHDRLALENSTGVIACDRNGKFDCRHVLSVSCQRPQVNFSYARFMMAVPQTKLLRDERSPRTTMTIRVEKQGAWRQTGPFESRRLLS